MQSPERYRQRARAQRTELRDAHDMAYHWVKRSGGLRRYIVVELRRAPIAAWLRLGQRFGR